VNKLKATPSQTRASRRDLNHATTLNIAEIGQSKSDAPHVAANISQMQSAAIRADHAQPRPRVASRRRFFSTEALLAPTPALFPATSVPSVRTRL
jgi:hypothetical protein